MNPQTVPSGAFWTHSPTNYSSGRNFGGKLFLPATGYRSNNGGDLNTRGSSGYFWSSTENGSHAWNMSLTSGGASMNYNYRPYGFSVRCVVE